MKKRLSIKVLSLVLMLALFVGMLATTGISVIAYTEDTYESAGFNFLRSQYDMRGMTYDSLIKTDAIDLYSDTDEVVAKMLVVDRDGHTDYVVLDFMIDRIDEFGFDQPEFVQTFREKEHIYYAGLMNYAYYDGDILKDISGSEIDSEEFFGMMAAFTTLGEQTPDAKNGYDGFKSWSDVYHQFCTLPDSTGYGGGVGSSVFSYLPGITNNGVASGLTFKSQAELNSAYNSRYNKNVNGTCGPTAMTNMFIYFKYRGFSNALISNDVTTTFSNTIIKSDWNNWNDATWWTKSIEGFKGMATATGYEYTMKKYPSASWNDFKTCIVDLKIPMYTYISVNTGTDTFAHVVVAVGAEEFEHMYTTTEQYWLFGWHEKEVSHTDTYRYIRVIDGWGTSNSARYIDFNGYFTTVKAIGFTLK